MPFKAGSVAAYSTAPLHRAGGRELRERTQGGGEGGGVDDGLVDVEAHDVGRAVAVGVEQVDRGADRELGEVAGVEPVEEGLSVRPMDVDLAERRRVHHRHRLARRIIGQTQNNQIRLCHHLAPSTWIPAAVGRQAPQFDIRQRTQAVAERHHPVDLA